MHDDLDAFSQKLEEILRMTAQQEGATWGPKEVVIDKQLMLSHVLFNEARKEVGVLAGVAAEAIEAARLSPSNGFNAVQS